MKLIQKPNKINRQIVGLIAAIIILAMLLCCLLNSCFLGDFYLLEKRHDMISIYKTLDNYCENGRLYNQRFRDEIINGIDGYGVSALVGEEDGSSYFYTNSDPEILTNQLLYTIDNTENIEYIKNTENYKLLTITFPDLEENYLVLLGKLSDGNIVFVRANIGGIEQTASVANIFLIYICTIVVILAIISCHFIVKHFTKPLYEIIDVTKRINNFEFTAKYTPQKFYNELDDLGEHVNEMSTTLERAIDQLQRANDSLMHDLEAREEAENTRKEFISNVSHELKTPIALIQGYAEGLQEGIMDDENSRQIYLDVILDEANKMNRLVREMLILNQLEAGQMSMDLVDFDVTDIIDGVVDANKIYFEAQNISYSFINKEPCVVHADEFLVEQVVTNFITNAIHYVMNENVIMVRYEFVKKGKVRICVFNSGNNIAKKDIKHIWEKFYKADKARSREYGGSGIGLSVVKATMDLLHEKYGVENLPNGVEFWFELSLKNYTKIK